MTSDDWQDLRNAYGVVAHAEAAFADEHDSARETLARAARAWLGDLIATAPTGEQ